MKHKINTNRKYSKQFKQKQPLQTLHSKQQTDGKGQRKLSKKAAEESVGYIRNPPTNQIPDELLQEWSIQQKESRLQIEKSKDSTKILSLKAERKAILKQMKKRKKELREKVIDEILKEVDSTKDDNKMFKAIKALHCKKKKVTFVNDEEGKSVSNPQEIYKVIEKHFKLQFHKQNQEPIPKFTIAAKKLRKEITADEVKRAVSKMSNNKAPGQDEIVIEMFKYGPEEMHSQMASILNNIFESNDNIKLGTGILLPLPKPKKAQGPVTHLRPITLLEVIRKILSKIFLNRTDHKINQYLSQSQSAYRQSWSTTDIVWAYRWIAAKAQNEDLKIYSTGIDMSSAFDTIDRQTVLNIADRIIDEDESRILRALLCDTTLEIEVKDATSTPFISNIGSPQER